MPNQSSQPSLSEQIAAGTSLGEQFVQDQRALQRAEIDQRIKKLMDTATAESGRSVYYQGSTPRGDRLLRRAMARDMEIRQKKDALLQYDCDSRVCPRAQKASLFIALQRLLDGSVLLTENLQHQDATLKDIQDLYQTTRQHLWSVGPFCRRFIHYLLGHIGDIVPIKAVYNDLRASPSSTYARLARQLSQDPDFYLFFLRSGQLSTICAADAPFGKLFKEQLKRALSGKEVKKAFDRKHLEHKSLLQSYQEKFARLQAQLKVSSLPADAEALQELYRTMQTLTATIQAEERAQAGLERSMPSMEALASDTVLVDALYGLWLSMLQSFEKMAQDFPEQHDTMAKSMALLCSQNTGDAPAFFAQVLQMYEKVHGMVHAMPTQASQDQQDLTTPVSADQVQPAPSGWFAWVGMLRFWEKKPVEPPQYSAPPLESSRQVSDYIAIIHDCIGRHIDTSVSVALAYGQSKIPVDTVRLEVFHPFFRDCIVSSAAPGKLPDYQWMRSLLQHLAQGDLQALSDQVLLFSLRHNHCHVLHKHADLLARECCSIWAQHADVTIGFGFDKQTVYAFEPVLKRLFETVDERSAPAFHDVVTCILRMVLAPRGQPVAMDLIDKIFILLDVSPTLRNDLVGMQQERAGLLQFFRVLFKNKLLITARNAAALRIQSKFRSYRVRRNLTQSERLDARLDIAVAQARSLDLSNLQKPRSTSSSFFSYDRGQDRRAEPVDLTWWQRINLSIFRYFLRRFKHSPAGMLRIVDILSKDPSQDSFWDRWFTFAGFLRARVPIVDPNIRLLLAQLRESIQGIADINPVFFERLLGEKANHLALYNLINVLINPMVPNNCPQSVDAIEKLFETVMDEVVTRPETYPAVQALLAIWLDPERFSARVQQAKDYQDLLVQKPQQDPLISAAQVLKAMPPVVPWRRGKSKPGANHVVNPMHTATRH